MTEANTMDREAWDTVATLYLVSTPIGNLEDVTMRALRVLREVGLIAAEDTRRTRRLLDRYDIHTPMTPMHEHNERKKAPRLVAELESGTDVALVTNAGTPNISDPGFLLVREAIEHGISVVPVPGPDALVPALAASGLATHRFVFEGFLPKKPGERRRRLETVAGQTCTVVLYESPYRIERLVKELCDLIPDRRVVLAREITKLHEEFMRGTPRELLAELEDRPRRGEFTVVIEGDSS